MLTVVVLTSKDHLYANALLTRLIRTSGLERWRIVALEQDAIVPGKGKLGGLADYLRVSGSGYVLAQAGKQILFLWTRLVTRLLGWRGSIYFPYFVNDLPGFTRRTLNGLKRQPAVDEVASFAPDLILSVFSREVVPASVLKIPNLGCLNVHPSLLPSYRGVSPTFWCLANGETRTGVTIHTMDPGIDTGPSCLREKVDVKFADTEHSLYLRLAAVGAELVTRILKSLGDGSGLPPPQPIDRSDKGSYFSLPTREAVRRFKERGCRFFHLREFLGRSHVIIS